MEVIFRLLLLIITGIINIVFLWILFLNPILGIILIGAEALIVWKLKLFR